MGLLAQFSTTFTSHLICTKQPQCTITNFPIKLYWAVGKASSGAINMMPICGVNIHTSLNSQPPKLILPQLFAPQLIVMYKDSHLGIKPNVS